MINGTGDSMNNFNCSGNIGTYTCIHLKGNNKLINALAI